MAKKEKEQQKPPVKERYTMPYNNRELSWMDFNLRVLEEATEKENPVMERLKFLSITASNLDEFFMVRVAGIMEQIHQGYTYPDPAGLTPLEQMDRLSAKIHDFSKKQYNCLNRSILPALKKHGLQILTVSALSDKQKKFIGDYFERRGRGVCVRGASGAVYPAAFSGASRK